METKKINPKTELLLGAGLNVLHFESQEWLETIHFWKDEVKFFEDLLNKKEPKNGSKENFSNMLKTLDQIHADLYKDLEDDIIDHEKLLSRIEKSEKGLSDSYYREKHRKIEQRMETFTRDFLSFKRIIFNYVKNL
jgi:hypothetical protein